MSLDLKTEAENYAQQAEVLPAFLGISLLNIKQKVATLLSLIGREGIFDQYTRHDISHIEEMLRSLKWIIPESTKNIMSSADWLLTVLAIYFHDLGMLVTKKEYEARTLSGFTNFCNDVLFSGPEGQDYRDRVEHYYPEPEKAERFLYQEFVRYNHAKRIGLWITGQAPNSLGVTVDTMQEVSKLLDPLDDDLVRRDLALVCESHHLNDLNNFAKYKISEQFGGTDDEAANLQYVAALLRTADLLHIKSDRTPSIAFRIINPTDPLSQEEWAKQMAVRRVKVQSSKNEENKPDTIEVYAYFTKESGFFGLTKYLSYADEQIRKTHGWVKEAQQYYRTPYEFPWRKIDTTHVESAGFISGEFGFSIDQEKILDLLTGHTLYNDTSVVIRELVQNSLDAIRLQHFLEPASEPGKVQIHWDSINRILSVEDNGTGMTKETIENHFLKVGASLYQDESFKEKYPNFSSISRFGIGVLSAFMVASEVEVTTCHPHEPFVRQISLRDVHRQYLIRSLDKDADEVAKHLVPHGTLIKLRVRKSADEFDVLEAAKEWIVLPNCEVTVTVDNALPVNIGFPSLKKAIEHELQEMGLTVDGTSIKVEQQEANGITVAYALKWSKNYSEWEFLRPISKVASDEGPMLGTCVEGIRVEDSTPGFEETPIVAIANATGPNAPKTNVARSFIEASGRDEMLRTIYSIYCNHVKTEIQKLHQERGYSLTGAAQETLYLLSPLIGFPRLRIPSTAAMNEGLLIENIRELPMLMIEQNGGRQVTSSKALRNEPYFWTNDCPIFTAAESIISQVPGEASLSGLISALNTTSLQLPNDPVLCGFEELINFPQFIFEGKEVDVIKVIERQKRIDLRWVSKTAQPRWLRISDVLPPSRVNRVKKLADAVLILQSDDLTITGLTEEIGVVASSVFLFPDSELAKYLTSWLNRLRHDRTDDMFDRVVSVLDFVGSLLKRGIDYTADTLDRLIDDLPKRLLSESDKKEISFIFLNTNTRCFNPHAWQRNEESVSFLLEEDY